MTGIAPDAITNFPVSDVPVYLMLTSFVDKHMGKTSVNVYKCHQRFGNLTEIYQNKPRNTNVFLEYG